MSADEITLLKLKLAGQEAEIAELQTQVDRLHSLLHKHANLLNARALKEELLVLQNSDEK